MKTKLGQAAAAAAARAPEPDRATAVLSALLDEPRREIRLPECFWPLVALAVFVALLLSLALIPLPSDRAARQDRLSCDIASQTCTTHHHERTHP